MAHKKGQGSSRNGRDSNPQYRGVKVFAGQFVVPGSIIVRQVGTKFHPGQNTKMAEELDDLRDARGHGGVPRDRSVHVDAGDRRSRRRELAGHGQAGRREPGRRRRDSGAIR